MIRTPTYAAKRRKLMDRQYAISLNQQADRRNDHPDELNDKIQKTGRGISFVEPFNSLASISGRSGAFSRYNLNCQCTARRRPERIFLTFHTRLQNVVNRHLRRFTSRNSGVQPLKIPTPRISVSSIIVKGVGSLRTRHVPGREEAGKVDPANSSIACSSCGPLQARSSRDRECICKNRDLAMNRSWNASLGVLHCVISAIRLDMTSPTHPFPAQKIANCALDGRQVQHINLGLQSR